MRSESKIDAARILISRQQIDPFWDAFVASHPEGQYEQTSAWAQAKSTEGWHPLRIFRLIKGEIHGGAQILDKKVPLIGKAAYASKGPLLTPNSSSQIIRRFLNELKQMVRREHILYLIVNPPDDSSYLEASLLKAGFQADPMENGQALLQGPAIHSTFVSSSILSITRRTF